MQQTNSLTSVHSLSLKKGLIVVFLGMLCFKITQIPENNTNPATLLPQSSNGNLINLNYTIDYYYETSSKVYDDDVNLILYINGTQQLYENGTIHYYLPEQNITDSFILDKLSLIFSEEQIDYFENHTSNQFYTTYFRQRNETNEPNPVSNFNNNAQYIAFWINSSQNDENYLRARRIIKFFNVQDPFNLVIRDDTPLLSENSWSNDNSDLRRPVKLLEAYYLTFFSNGVSIQMYYDKENAILLRAKIEITDENSTFRLDFSLKGTSLPLDFQEDNPYWINFRNQMLIGSSIGIIVLGTSFYFFRSKMEKSQKQKEKLLDQI